MERLVDLDFNFFISGTVLFLFHHPLPVSVSTDLKASSVLSTKTSQSTDCKDCMGFSFFCHVPQLYLWGSPILGEVFVHVTIFKPTIEI